MNSSKSKCIGCGPRYKNTCASIITRNSTIIERIGSCRYLAIFVISGPKLKTSNDNVKAKFYRALNSIIRKIGRCASHEITVSLIKANAYLYCIMELKLTTSVSVKQHHWNILFHAP